jgi:hypothetical protein
MEPIPSVPKPAGGISTSHAKENTNHEATGLMTRLVPFIVKMANKG